MLPFLARTFLLLAAAFGLGALGGRAGRPKPRRSAAKPSAEAAPPVAAAERSTLTPTVASPQAEAQAIPAPHDTVAAFAPDAGSAVTAEAVRSPPALSVAEPAASPGRIHSLWSAPPQDAAPETGPALPPALEAPRGGQPDNLTLISGIGPSIERLLFENGVFHFDQIAAWSEADALRIDGLTGFRGRVARVKWIDQARRFAAEAPASG